MKTYKLEYYLGSEKPSNITTVIVKANTYHQAVDILKTNLKNNNITVYYATIF